MLQVCSLFKNTNVQLTNTNKHIVAVL